MILFLFFTSVFVVCFSQVDAQSCKTPSGGEGDCLSVFDCGPLFALVNKKDRTPEDNQLLKDSQCGFRGDVPAVCCPKPCYTPEGHEGKCVGLGSCPHIANMLKKPVKPENVAYVRKLVCPGPEEHSVCCGPPPGSEPPGKVKNCNSVMSAFPPDHRTGCCGIESNADNKITGGEVAGIDQYPWLVVIEYIRLGTVKLLCGGSLISGKYVLTAAHCVVGPILDFGTPKNVRLGEFNTTNNGPDCVNVEAGGVDCTDGATLVPIEKTIPHPEYRPSSFQRKHDIALIRLKDTASYTYFIRPICLPKRDYSVNPPPNLMLSVAGWGRYIQFENGSGISSKVKLYVRLPHVQREICQEAQKKVRNGDKIVLWKGQICAGGEPGKDSCKGDSGGPLMYESNRVYEAVGIVSFGPEKCGLLDVPGVYTNVYEYMPWITSTIMP